VAGAAATAEPLRHALSAAATPWGLWGTRDGETGLMREETVEAGTGEVADGAGIEGEGPRECDRDEVGGDIERADLEEDRNHDERIAVVACGVCWGLESQVSLVQYVSWDQKKGCEIRVGRKKC
jgi:hypothetical protein